MCATRYPSERKMKVVLQLRVNTSTQSIVPEAQGTYAFDLEIPTKRPRSEIEAFRTVSRTRPVFSGQA
jgi:hypothetical protein